MMELGVTVARNKGVMMRYLLFVLFLMGAVGATAGNLSSMWSEGTPAVGTAETLAKSDPIPVNIPDMVLEQIEGKTALFYFSPTCPHCQEVMGEVNSLAVEFTDVAWLGIASARTSEDILQAFALAYSPEFPMIIDSTGEFSRAVGARATPNVYIIEPAADDAEKNALLYDSYLPYSRGLAPLFKMRNSADSSPFAHFEGYQGSRACLNCHQQEGTSWYLTHHAQAYYTLYNRDRVDEEKCVKCHVVGLGEATGFEMGDHRSPLANVGCEACHGPSGPHDGVTQDATASCEGCHDAEHSINFSVAKGMPHIDHYMANDMSDRELKQRIDAISNGTAEKPLLAFADGETVGVAVCKSCHEDVHKGDVHPNAMKSLNRKQKKKQDCVQCHATQKTIGMATEEVSDYHTSDGVGCESCHGSGQAHAAEPSKDNIVGLGDSCPVCVIEAVCTSCHNQKWDPEWNLDHRLEQLPK